MNFFKKLAVGLGIIMFGFMLNFTFAEDALDEVLGVDSEAGNYQIVNNKIDVQWLVSSWEDSIIIKVSKFMLKLAVIVGVFVFLIWGIRFILSFGDDSKAKKVRDNLMIAVLGFVIAFWAWVILQIILSIWPSIQW